MAGQIHHEASHPAGRKVAEPPAAERAVPTTCSNRVPAVGAHQLSCLGSASPCMCQAKRPRDVIEDMLKSESPVPAQLAQSGPRKAMKLLTCTLVSPDGRSSWVARARVAAVLGSCPLSLDKVASGIRCWLELHGSIFGEEARPSPPSLEALLAWSRTFRCSGTFTNYVAHV